MKEKDKETRLDREPGRKLANICPFKSNRRFIRSDTGGTQFDRKITRRLKDRIQNKKTNETSEGEGAQPTFDSLEIEYFIHHLKKVGWGGGGGGGGRTGGDRQREGEGLVSKTERVRERA